MSNLKHFLLIIFTLLLIPTVGFAFGCNSNKLGSKKNNSMSVFNGQAVFALKGNDKIKSKGGGYTCLYGGEGNDKYTIAYSNSSQYVYLYYTKGKDQIDAKFLWASSSYTLQWYDHLMVLDVGTAAYDGMIVFDWKKKNNKIEKIKTGDGYNLNYNQAKNWILNGSGYLRKYTTSQLRSLTGENNLASKKQLSKALKAIRKKEKKFKNKKKFTSDDGYIIDLFSISEQKNQTDVEYLVNHFSISHQESFDNSLALNISNESLNQKYDLNINIVLETDEFGINKEPIFVGATGSLHRGFTDLSLNTGIKKYSSSSIPISSIQNNSIFMNDGANASFIRAEGKHIISPGLLAFLSVEQGWLDIDFGENPFISANEKLKYRNLFAGFKKEYEKNNSQVLMGISNGFNLIDGSFTNHLPTLFQTGSDYKIDTRQNDYFYEARYMRRFAESLDISVLAATDIKYPRTEHSTVFTIKLNF